MDLEKTYDKIYRYVYFKINNRSIAEDITQETFLRFISKKGDFHDSDIRYLYTIARNLCIDEYRRVKPEPLTDEINHSVVDSDNTENRLLVKQALEKLPVEDQELLLLRYVNEESVNTMSKTLGISRFALYRRLKNAEEKLRLNLEVEE